MDGDMDVVSTLYVTEMRVEVVRNGFQLLRFGNDVQVERIPSLSIS
jgi:hypothetical protein